MKYNIAVCVLDKRVSTFTPFSQYAHGPIKKTLRVALLGAFCLGTRGTMKLHGHFIALLRADLLLALS